MGNVMKAYLVWLKTELKRVATRLPSLFIGAIVLTMVVSAIAFCAYTVMNARGQKQEITAKVALVAPEDPLTDMAVQFVMRMESLEEWCYFERYSLEDGLKALNEKEVVAVIALPENVIESILNGTNIPAKLYLPQGNELGSTLIQIMAEAGVSLLQVAQGEIYAATDLYKEYPLNQSLEEVYEEINLYNLNIALTRENLFKTVSLSETEGITAYAYYGGTAISLFVLLFGLLVADLMVEHTKRERMLDLNRITLSAQVLGRWKVLTGVSFLWAFCITVILAVTMKAGNKSVWQILRLCVKHSLSLLLAVSCIVALYLLIGTLLREKLSFMFLLGLGVLILGYAGGYFVPSSLLAKQVKSLGAFLPTTYLHDICSGILARQNITLELSKQGGYLCLFLWTVICLTLCILLRKRRCIQ